MTGTLMAAEASALLLPENPRLPDLSQTRIATANEFVTWWALAEAAFAWGPDERNGCIRSHSKVLAGPVWRDADGLAHSPDPYTPAHLQPTFATWEQRGVKYLPGDRPSLLTVDAAGGTVSWTAAGGALHRATGPAYLLPATSSQWAHRPEVWGWQGGRPSQPLATLLAHAWVDEDLPDATAQELLEEAAHTDPGWDVPVSAQTWLAHVIGAHSSGRLSPATRAWCALLTA